MLIIEIAKKAEVSPATVSRAINQPHIVAPESLARIRAVMQENNYVPTPANRRRGPKSRQSQVHRIGVWFVGAKASNPSLHWFQDQVLQMQSADPTYSVDMSLLFSNNPDELPRALSEGGLDGVIIQGMEPSAACLAKLGKIPHVWFMTRRSLSYAGDYVEPNNEENGEMAADYLKERGHKTVAVITVDPDYSATTRRIGAFVERAKAHGLKVHGILGRSTPGGVSYLEIAPVHGESQTLVRRMLASTPRPTGIYLPVDHFCGSFFRAMREAGHKPGRAVEAVLGNFNPVIYHNLDHTPAVIDINLSLLVRTMVHHLVWRIENPSLTGRIGIQISPSLAQQPAPTDGAH
jgi:DNA-binding LacI/PurR family transcriptional regulator